MSDVYNKTKNDIVDFIKSKDYTPVNFKGLSKKFKITDKNRDMYTMIIDELINNGVIIKNKRGKYIKTQDVNMLTGEFIGHKRGFGFVEIEDRDGDIFIPADFTSTAMNKDKVLVKITKSSEGDKRTEGKIVKILERGIEEVVGTYECSDKFGFVVPDDKKIDKDIFIAKKSNMSAVDGHKVVAKITNWPTKPSRNPEGEIVEILGHKDDPGVDILSIVRAYGFNVEFPEDVLEEVNDVEVEVLESEKVGRKDLRDLKMVTIDGKEAKDLDDAVTIEKLNNGNYKLGVHIADVTHYVKENSPLDKEALKRGTSVYLVDRVVPMLPHKLSNGICSLNAGVDRLAMTCMMEIDQNGEVIDHDIYESLIHVDERMNYEDVYKIVSGDKIVRERYKDYINMFENMDKLRKILNKKRVERGSIDFDIQETKVIVDDKGKPIDIVKYDRNEATKIIEEFMLAANETVAEDFHWKSIPFVYRTHEEPDSEKVNKLKEFINNFGYSLKGTDLHPKDFQNILDKAEGKPEEMVVRRLLLRTMQQAKYRAESEEHFGLAAKFYCHFTSPIRRYPDLQIHRIIKETLNGKMTEKRINNLEANLPAVAKFCSKNEREAEQAERETIKLKKAEFMKDKVGEEFDGIISGVTSFGIYVELENTVEGLIRVVDLDDDYYVYNQEQHMFIGEKTNKMYKIGQKVRIEVSNVNLLERTIDFILAEKK